MNVQRIIRIVRRIDVDELQEMPAVAWGAVGAGVLVFLGALLGWVTFDFAFAEPATPQWTQGIGAAAGVPLVLAILYNQWNRVTQGIAVATGGVTVAVFYYVYSVFPASGEVVEVSIAAGAYLSLLGALLAIAIGVVGLLGLEDRVPV